MAWTIGSLPQAGGTHTIRTCDGSIVTGTFSGGNGGTTVGGKTFFPV